MTLKLGLYIAAALFIVALFGKTYQAGREHERTKLTAQWQAAFDKQEKESQAKEQAERDKNHAASVIYEQQIEALRTDSRPIPIVSVPKCPRRIPVSEASTTGSQPSETSADELARENGRTRAALEFSNGLREYAKDCQSIALQLNAVLGLN